MTSALEVGRGDLGRAEMEVWEGAWRSAGSLGSGASLGRESNLDWSVAGEMSFPPFGFVDRI